MDLDLETVLHQEEQYFDQGVPKEGKSLLSNIMLAAKYCVSGDESFAKIKKNGKLYQSKNFALAVLNRKDNEPSRFGFIISTKISLKATIRNKKKRALAEGIRQVYTRVKPGYDCAFLAKKEIVSSYTSDIMNEVRESIEKAKLIK